MTCRAMTTSKNQGLVPVCRCRQLCGTAAPGSTRLHIAVGGSGPRLRPRREPLMPRVLRQALIQLQRRPRRLAPGPVLACTCAGALVCAARRHVRRLIRRRRARRQLRVALRRGGRRRPGAQARWRALLRHAAAAPRSKGQHPRCIRACMITSCAPIVTQCASWHACTQ
jgi:hypothetical protein